MTSREKSKRTRSFASLGAVLEEAIEGLGLGEMVSKGAAMLLWPEVVGETVARVTHPETVRGHTLVVNVADNAWLQQLRYMEEDMVERLNGAIGKPVIEGLYFKLGPISPASTEEERPEEPVELDPETAAHIEELVAGVDDPELRKTLKLILAASRRIEEDT
jgi:hypothetical protein